MCSEWEKMLAGELYDPSDAELTRARERARDLCLELNGMREGQVEERRQLLDSLLGSVGEDAFVQPPFFCDYGKNITLGKNCFLNFSCILLDVCEINVGDHTLFGPSVQVYTATHPLDYKQRRGKEFGKPIEIGSDVWLGGGVIICPGVTIGSRSVIGAGSVVTRDVPEAVFAAGNPCRVIRGL